MLLQILYSFDEILATLQFMKARRQKGKSLWHVLWHGGTIENGSTDDSARFDAPPMIVLREMLSSGIHFTWTMGASVLIGILLMFTRVIFSTEAEAANSDHVIGSLVITFSIMALSEAALPLRFINIIFGAWLIAAPWMLTGYSGLASAAGVIVGVLLILLALPLAPIKNHYETWDRWISMGPPLGRDRQAS